MSFHEPSHSTSIPANRVESGWTGWIGFASTMLLLVGTFQIIFGFVALFKDDYFVTNSDGVLVTIDYSAWGWVHLALGVIAIAVALGITTGATWARAAGVIIAVVNATANLAFLSASPVWCTMLIAFDVLVIWALTVHGGEMRDT